MNERVCDTVRGGNVSGFICLPYKYWVQLEQVCQRRRGQWLRCYATETQDAMLKVLFARIVFHVAAHPARPGAVLPACGWLGPTRDCSKDEKPAYCGSRSGA
jgi:hypothetical protein